MRPTVFWVLLLSILRCGQAEVIIRHYAPATGDFQGRLCTSVPTDVISWQMRVIFNQPIINLFTEHFANIDWTSPEKSQYILTSTAANGVQHAGTKLCFDIMGRGTGGLIPTANTSIDQSARSASVASRRESKASGDGEIMVGTMKVDNDWGNRFEAQIDFKVTENIEGWLINVTFSSPVNKIDVMIGDAVWHSADGLAWAVVNKQDKAFYHVGDTLSLRFFGSLVSKGTAPTAESVLTNLGKDNWKVEALPNKANSKYNYDDVLMKSILFYEAQRSGKLPSNNRIPYRHDSALNDKGANGEDLSGGWYDAGDHVKFNFPLAFSTVILAWGLEQFHDAYEAAGQLDLMYDSIKWPLDYLVKCHVDENVLYVQVGNAGADHSYWGPPELMTMARPAYKIDAAHPGSDVAMETAAAFAAGSLIFKDKDPAYAATLLAHAQTLWQFAVDHPGKYSDSVQAAAGFYSSYNFTDEMCWGSMWLYRATEDAKYLTEAKKWFDPTPDWGMSWDDKTVGCQLLLYMATKEDAYKQAVIGTFKFWFPGSGEVLYTPKGLAWRLQWASLRYAANMAMAAIMAAEAGIMPEEYRHWAMCQIHYALGDTGFSYVVGFGDKGWPHNPHHRSSSCPNVPAPCGSQFMTSNEPNVHVLYGALVGGPDQADVYEDERSNYVSNEVSCDYNAGFTTAVAGLRSLLLRKLHPEQTGQSTCPYK